MADPAPWAFSLQVHGAPGVEAFCLALQDAHGGDVNLLLCAAWCGASGRGRLGEAGIARLDAATAGLRGEVVARLRAARRWLKPAAASSPRLAALRERVKAIELEAEREVQFLLAAAIDGSNPAPAAMPGREIRRADAVANIDACLRQIGARLDPAVLQQAASDWIDGN